MHLKKAIKGKIRQLLGIENLAMEQALQADSIKSVCQLEQKRLFFYYQNLVREKKYLPLINDVGFRVYSQTDEDGILLYIFSLIGMINKKCVDIAFASPFGANTTNLIRNWNWRGLLICGRNYEAEASNVFFAKNPNTFLAKPKIVNEWITAENVNEVLVQSGFSGEVDLFSLDIDGVDYWIWKNLEVIAPRVVVLEFQKDLGLKPLTVPYKPDFDRFDIDENFYGASLPAFVKLADKKGYRLVALNNLKFNAFFIKNGIAEDIIPTKSVEECLQGCEYNKSGLASKFDLIEV